MNEQFNSTFRELERILNEPANSIDYLTVGGFYDVLISDKFNGRKVPEGLTDELMKNLTFNVDH